MDYEKINMGAYNLHLIKTTKFKTITVEVNFREKLIKENITLKEAINNINNKYDNISKKDIYNASLNLKNIKL